MKLLNQSFLQAIEGQWKIIRQIRNYANDKNTQPVYKHQNNSYIFIGTATCQYIENNHNCLARKLQCSSLVSYHQKLKLKGNQQIQSSKQYYFAQDLNQKNIVNKFFEDGKLFQQIDLNCNQQFQSFISFQTYHLCNTDIYKGLYKFNPMQFYDGKVSKYELVYRVNGNNKNYQATSNYERINIHI